MKRIRMMFIMAAIVEVEVAAESTEVRVVEVEAPPRDADPAAAAEDELPPTVRCPRGPRTLRGLGPPLVILDPEGWLGM